MIKKKNTYLGVFLVEPLHGSQRGDEHCRLTVDRLHQLCLGSFHAQRQQVVSENLPGHRKHLFNVRILQKSATHAHKLTTLAREEQDRTVAGVFFRSPLLLDVRTKIGGFGRRGARHVAGEPPAQGDQRPDLPSGGCRQPGKHG